MDLYLLDRDFKQRRIVENHEAAIWTERYDQHGDAEIVGSRQHFRIQDYPHGWYLYHQESLDLMIIRSVTTSDDAEDGAMLQIRAKSLTSLLAQRRVYGDFKATDMPLEDCVKRLLNENAIAPSDPNRIIPGLVYKNADSSVPKVHLVTREFQGENLYDVIQNMCAEFDIGMRITWDGFDFIFQLYGGVNRSDDQQVRESVKFSPDFDNILSSSYLKSTEGYANIVRVQGEYFDEKSVTTDVRKAGAPVPKGLDRFESYLKPSKQERSDPPDPVKDTKSAYLARIRSAGLDDLKDKKLEVLFDGEVDSTMASGYGSKYRLGDMVQLSDGESINFPARVIEYVRSDDSADGVRAFPTLRIKED